MAASLEGPEDLRTMRDSVPATFDFFSDDGGRLVDLLGVRHAGGNPMDGGDLPQSSSYLVRSDGTILWSHKTSNYRLRPRPEHILDVADALLRP